jgi:hypothetical protein
MRNLKWLMVPFFAILVAPMLGGCMMEERYPYGGGYYYHRPYYVRYHHYRPMRRVVVVGKNDVQPPADGVAPENAPATADE